MKASMSQFDILRESEAALAARTVALEKEILRLGGEICVWRKVEESAQALQRQLTELTGSAERSRRVERRREKERRSSC